MHHFYFINEEAEAWKSEAVLPTLMALLGGAGTGVRGVQFRAPSWAKRQSWWNLQASLEFFGVQTFCVPCCGESKSTNHIWEPRLKHTK